MSAAGLPKDLEVLIVEDEAIVAISLESMIEDIGCRVAGPIMRLDRAMEAVEGGLRPGVAILDVNLGSDLVYPLAQLLVLKGIPIVFTTGYGRDGLPDEWQAHIVVQKPYTFEQVERALAQALAAHAGGTML